MGFTHEDCFSFLVYCKWHCFFHIQFIYYWYTEKSTEFCLLSLNLASCYLYKFPSGHRTMGFMPSWTSPIMPLKHLNTEFEWFTRTTEKGHQHQGTTWFEHPVLCPQGQQAAQECAISGLRGAYEWWKSMRHHAGVVRTQAWWERRRGENAGVVWPQRGHLVHSEGEKNYFLRPKEVPWHLQDNLLSHLQAGRNFLLPPQWLRVRFCLILSQTFFYIESIVFFMF